MQRDAEPREARRDVAGEAADEAAERLDLRERRLELLGIEVGAEPSHDRHLRCMLAPIRHRWLSYPSRHCNVPEGDRGGRSKGRACASGSWVRASSDRRRTRTSCGTSRSASSSSRSPTPRAPCARRSARATAIPELHPSMDGLVGLGLDAVVVAVPDAYHADVSVQALEAGLHVLCEKPLALSVAECDRIAAARDAAGRVVQVGTMKRFDPAYLRLLELLPEDARRRAATSSVEVRDPDQWPVRRPLPAGGGRRLRSGARRRPARAHRSARSATASDGEPAPGGARAFEGYLSAMVHDVSLLQGILEHYGDALARACRRRRLVGRGPRDLALGAAARRRPRAPRAPQPPRRQRLHRAADRALPATACSS